jgi:protein SCO1/2
MKLSLVLTSALALGLSAAALYGRHVAEPPASIGGPFHLIEARTSQPFDDAKLRGAPAVLFFGFTRCPDVCPTALSRASRWLEALGSDAGRLRFVFITLDPERDTAEQMARYLTAFDSRIIGLTGARAEVDRVIAGYKIVALKRPTLADGDYVYDHTARLQLFDARGRFQGTLDFDDPQPEALAKLRALIRGEPISGER